MMIQTHCVRQSGRSAIPSRGVPLRAESDSRVAWKDKRTAARSDEFLPYQLSTVVQCTPVAFTGDGELGFDSGEGA